jgi:tRNA(fMet)-specific endonuclease VapC
MRYLLDTNVVIAMLNRSDDRILSTALSHRSEDVGTSSIVIHELYYGAYKSLRQERNLAIIQALRFPVLNFDAEDAREAGQIRAALAALGKPIGPYDVLLAGQAARHQLVFVTANTREFERVPGLICEDWSN